MLLCPCCGKGSEVEDWVFIDIWFEKCEVKIRYKCAHCDTEYGDSHETL
jgi:hypothetical protein